MNYGNAKTKTSYMQDNVVTGFQLGLWLIS